MNEPDSPEYHALLLDEAGQPLTAAQRARLDAYQPLKDSLPLVGGEHRPPGGWEARVMAALARQDAPLRRPLWALIPVGVALLLALVWWPRPSPTRPITFDVSIQHTNTARNTGAAVHDIASIRVDKAAGFWVYQDERQLVLRCPGDEVCQSDADGRSAALRLESPGRYRVILLSPEAAKLSPTGGYDQDMAAITTMGGRPQWRDIDVF